MLCPDIESLTDQSSTPSPSFSAANHQQQQQQRRQLYKSPLPIEGDRERKIVSLLISAKARRASLLYNAVAWCIADSPDRELRGYVVDLLSLITKSPLPPPPTTTTTAMAIQVISPGYGRTGTTSLKNALEILGFGPCYHMNQVIRHMGTHPQLWLDGYKGRGLPIHKIFDDYKSMTDWPASDFYQEIMQEYPDAKVVLTVRDPDSWWSSIKDTVHSQSSPLRAWGVFFFKAFSPRFQDFSYLLRHIAPLNMGEADAKADFLRHNEEVKAVVPAEKLLEFSVKEGWGPLCAFLGVPVPDVPFPRSNSREEDFYKIPRKMCMAGWVAMLLAIAAAGATAGTAFFFGGKRMGGAVTAVNMCILSWCMMEAVRVSRFYGKKATKEGSAK